MLTTIPSFITSPDKNKQQRLHTLALLIPCKEDDKAVRNVFLTRLIGVHSNKLGCTLFIRKRVQVIQRLTKEKKQGKLKPLSIVQPIERQLTISFLRDETWSDLISRCKLQNLRPGLQLKSKIGIYQAWIINICYHSLKPSQANYLSIILTRRNSQSITYLKNHCSHQYYHREIQSWLDKDYCQIMKLRYSLERNLFVAIKKGFGLEQICEALNFTDFAYESVTPLFLDDEEWMDFLCWKIQKTSKIQAVRIKYPTMQLFWKKQSLSSININQLSEKLKYFMNQKMNFQESLTNKIEVSLLKDIKLNNNWKIAKNNIVQLMNSISTNKTKFIDKMVFSQISNQQTQKSMTNSIISNISANIFHQYQRKSARLQNTVKNSLYLNNYEIKQEVNRSKQGLSVSEQLNLMDENVQIDSLNKEQIVFLALIELQKQKMVDLQQRLINNMKSEQLSIIYKQNQEYLRPIQQKILTFYKNRRQQIIKIDNPQLRILIQLLLLYQTNNNSNLIKKQYSFPQTNVENNLTASFVEEFNQCISQIQEKKIDRKIKRLYISERF